MKSKHTINIAQDFSKVPIGRYLNDSDSNGTLFRDSVLIPALKKHHLIEINLDDTEGYGSSFLEESFGGLVRVHKISSADLLSRISFISLEDPSLVEEIESYIKDAAIK